MESGSGMDCLYCGKEIPMGRGTRKFCHNAHKQAYYRKNLHQYEEKATARELEEARLRIEELEQQVSHLTFLLDIEKRYHQDTQARSLKAWLRKQPISAIGELGQRLQADVLLPPRGSRAGYEARLRQSNYSQDDLHELEHLWKQMLLQS